MGDIDFLFGSDIQQQTLYESSGGDDSPSLLFRAHSSRLLPPVTDLEQLVTEISSDINNSATTVSSSGNAEELLVAIRDRLTNPHPSVKEYLVSQLIEQVCSLLDYLL